MALDKWLVISDGRDILGKQEAGSSTDAEYGTGCVISETQY